MLKFSLQDFLQSFESLFWYGVKVYRYMVIQSKERQICLLIALSFLNQALIGKKNYVLPHVVAVDNRI